MSRQSVLVLSPRGGGAPAFGFAPFDFYALQKSGIAHNVSTIAEPAKRVWSEGAQRPEPAIAVLAEVFGVVCLYQFFNHGDNRAGPVTRLSFVHWLWQ